MLLPFPIMVFIYYFLAKKIEQLTEETESVQDDINSHIEEVLSCSYSLRANNASQWFAEKAEIPFRKKFGMERKISRIETVYDLALITGMLNLLTTAVYFIGGLFAFSGQITVGMIVAMALYYAKLWTPLEFYLNYPKDYAEYKAHKKRLDEVMSLGNVQIESQAEVSLNPMEQITIHNLNYSATNKCIFRNLNFSVKQKEKIAILGENGSGKSTLSNILCGLLTEYEGEVYYNHLNYVDIKGESIREHICLIPATPQLFSGTIADNIMLGGKQPIPKQLVEVLEQRGLSLQKQLEENASNISSGEAKLVQLARGIYRDCDMYIVDEPLNFIDKEYVDIILDVIENLLSEKTLLVISHDDRALRLCQKVYQLKNHALL